VAEPEPSLEEINRSLARIQDELLATPSDAFAEKYRLQSERDRLRKLTRGFAVDYESSRDTDDIRKEVEALRARVSQIESKRAASGKMADGGFGGVGAHSGPADGVMLNAAFDEAQGIPQLIDRIARLETILQKRQQPSGSGA
jgi:hypothetical protein